MRDYEGLGRRAAACKNWEWLPGMLTWSGLRIIRVDADGHVFGYHAVLNYLTQIEDGAFPAFDDDATLGCLQAIVRDVYWDSDDLDTLEGLVGMLEETG